MKFDKTKTNAEQMTFGYNLRNIVYDSICLRTMYHIIEKRRSKWFACIVSNSKNANIELDVSGRNCKKILGKNFIPLKINALRKPQFCEFPLKYGDVLIFNGYLPHRSGINKTKKARIQMYVTYVSSKNKNIRKKYFKEKILNFPPNNMRKENISYKYLVWKKEFR